MKFMWRQKKSVRLRQQTSFSSSMMEEFEEIIVTALEEPQMDRCVKVRESKCNFHILIFLTFF